MNTVLSNYGQLCDCPEILKKSCNFFVVDLTYGCRISWMRILAYRGVFKLWLKNLCIWHIIYLTGQPEDRLSLSVPANYNAM